MFAPALGDDFRRLILDCLAKDPTQRPASGHELRARLASLSFALPWTPSRAAAWWAEHASWGTAADRSPSGAATVISGPTSAGATESFAGG